MDVTVLSQYCQLSTSLQAPITRTMVSGTNSTGIPYNLSIMEDSFDGLQYTCRLNLK